jgi:predicted Fe-Mo cluster-binding NifX family protein
MGEEQKRVLEMLAAGKISAEEAAKLLDKLAAGSASQSSAADPSSTQTQSAGKPKYLRIIVEHPGRDQVNVRIPLALAGSGARLLAVMPARLTERLAEYGIDSTILSAAGCSGVEMLREANIDVEKGDGKKVRIYCE